MPVYINNFSKIAKRLGIEPNGSVQSYFTERCYEYMDKYVPMDRGNLRTIVDIESNYIIYESPYASYQYYGRRKDGSHVINPENYTTEGTCPYWDEKMISAEIDDVVKDVQDYIKYHGGKN